MLPAADQATVRFLMPIFRKQAEHSLDFTSLAKTKKAQKDALIQGALLCEQTVFHMHQALKLCYKSEGASDRSAMALLMKMPTPDIRRRARC
jgi:hypothetical protein